MKIDELNSRSAEIFRQIVESYLETGTPVGSAVLARTGALNVSPATIRNTMADLEHAGLLFSPHTSAGRMPTEIGLRLFVDGFLEVGALSRAERAEITNRCQTTGRSVEEVLNEASSLLSGLSHCASVVVAPKANAPIKHIEFVALAPGRALVVIVTSDGNIENRSIELPLGLPQSALVEAGNYLSARLEGRTLEDFYADITQELESQRAELDQLTKEVVKAGLATWSGEKRDAASLIVKGRSNLLENDSALENLERIRQLFDDLETKETMAQLLDLSQRGDGVKIFIGAENQLFSLSGSSVIVAPYKNDTGHIIGAVGVIGPTRINYARIIPMVDFTARIIGKML